MTAIISLLAITLTVAQAPSPSTPLTPADVSSPAQSTIDVSPAPTRPRARLLTRARALNITGLSILAVTSPLWGVMAGGLHGGVKDARAYNDLVAKANHVPRPLAADEQGLLDISARSGARMNRLAIAAGVAAGVLTVIAAALLGRAHVLRREARAISPLVLPRGLGVGWQMHF